MSGRGHPSLSSYVSGTTILIKLTDTHMAMLEPLVHSANHGTSPDVFQAAASEGGVDDCHLLFED